MERKVEKEYIVSLIEDLKTDSTRLSYLVKRFETAELQLDTVLKMYHKIAIGYNDTLRRNLPAVIKFPDFTYTDRVHAATVIIGPKPAASGQKSPLLKGRIIHFKKGTLNLLGHSQSANNSALIILAPPRKEEER